LGWRRKSSPSLFQDATVTIQSVLPALLTGFMTLILAACATSASHSPDLSATAASPALVNPGQATDLTVFAAASLTEAFRDISRAFETAYPGAHVSFNFAGSQQLALQIELGAQADLFASADQRNMDRLVAAGLVNPDAPVTFAHNRMTVILPAGNPGRVETLQDLAKPGLKLILAGEQVPAGTYARQVLDNMSRDPAYGSTFKHAVLENVVSNEENVKRVVAKVQLGEADAGFVYSSDALPGLDSALLRFDIPERYNVEAAYPIATLGNTSRAELARQFIRFLLAPAGRRLLEQRGLVPAAVGE
jgi:molybdate transport system substrate-binding protein